MQVADVLDDAGMEILHLPLSDETLSIGRDGIHLHGARMPFVIRVYVFLTLSAVSADA